MTILDITDWRTKGLALAKEIEDTCGHQNRSALHGLLPDVIKMKHSQFDDLKRVMNMPTLEGSDEPFYYTKYNVMEINLVGQKDEEII